MNNIFNRFRQPNGQPNVFNIMQQFRQVQQNPSQIGQLLYNTGRINQQQLQDIQKMSNPRQIGEYLMGQNPQFKQMYDQASHVQPH